MACESTVAAFLLLQRRMESSKGRSCRLGGLPLSLSFPARIQRELRRQSDRPPQQYKLRDASARPASCGPTGTAPSLFLMAGRHPGARPGSGRAEGRTNREAGRTNCLATTAGPVRGACRYSRTVLCRALRRLPFAHVSQTQQWTHIRRKTFSTYVGPLLYEERQQHKGCTRKRATQKFQLPESKGKILVRHCAACVQSLQTRETRSGDTNLPRACVEGSRRMWVRSSILHSKHCI